MTQILERLNATAWRGDLHDVEVSEVQTVATQPELPSLTAIGGGSATNDEPRSLMATLSVEGTHAWAAGDVAEEIFGRE